MKVNANTLRKGHVIEWEGKLWVVIKNDILTPGKGNAVAQIEMRDVRTGVKSQTRCRTQESIERVRLEQNDCTFLYAEGDNYLFMNSETYDQIAVPADVLGEQAAYLQDGMKVEIETYEAEPLNVSLPDLVTCTITEADPVVKGQTASSSYKPAVLDNGLRILVPPHIETGTRIVVRTEDNTYYERAKD
jgi:elongation factor P